MIVVENTEALRDWLVEELEPICDADPGVLAKYILALVKRDKEEDVLRTKCLTSLDVFLAQETTAFVDKLIHTLVTQSYIQEEYDPTDWTAPTTENVDLVDDKKEEKAVVENTADEKNDELEEVDNSSLHEAASDKEDSKEAARTKSRDRSLSSISSASEKLDSSRSKSNSKEKGSPPPVKQRSPRSSRKRAPRRQVVDDRPRRKKRKDEKIVRKGKRKDKSKKCPDYEQKGFCKKGDACPFDHGSDPFKVDKLPTESFMSNLFPTTFASFPPPPPGMPNMPFPFPPPGLLNIPPPPPGVDFLTRPPTFPSTNNGGMSNSGPFNSNVSGSQPLAQEFRAPKRQASDNIISLTQPQPPRFNYNRSHNGSTAGVPKRPRYTPWTKGRGTPDNTTLELRKIPYNMNTEEKLREHFDKFGSVETVTIGINEDKQAAIVKFSTHASARSACQAPEPIFNNRFIAVFWHAGGGAGNAVAGNQTTSQLTTTSTENVSNNQLTTATNQDSQSSNSNDPEKQPAIKTSEPVAPRQEVLKVIKKPVRWAAVTRAQRIALAKSQIYGQNTSALQAHLEAQEQLKQQKVESTMKLIQAQEENRRKKEDERKAAIKMKTSLIEQKRELLSKYLEEQKKLLSKLEKGKATISASDKKMILSTLKALEESCSKLRPEIDQLLSAAKPKPPPPVKPTPATSLLSSSPLLKHKRETQKELLDAELELLTDKNAEEKLKLQRKLVELKKEAVLLGLMGRSKPAQITGGMPSSASPFAAATPSRSYGPSVTNTTPTQPQVPDTRPKTIKVSGFELEEKDEVIVHFSKLGKVENRWEENGVLYFEYRNRIDSLNAAQKGFKFKNKTLTVHWHRGPHRGSSTTSLDDSGSASSLNNSALNNSSGGGGNINSSSSSFTNSNSNNYLTPSNSSITNTYELARVRMESRDNSFSALLTEDDEEEAERLWRMTANISY